mmetsp:Transcript_17233/g.38120  ORF Transcript_17233/g.38120 Transcript_17233/m.38120 type:complete len:310 (-) Transcript_17233:631-1560(-)
MATRQQGAHRPPRRDDREVLLAVLRDGGVGRPVARGGLQGGGDGELRERHGGLFGVVVRAGASGQGRRFRLRGPDPGLLAPRRGFLRDRLRRVHRGRGGRSQCLFPRVVGPGRCPVRRLGGNVVDERGVAPVRLCERHEQVLRGGVHQREPLREVQRRQAESSRRGLRRRADRPRGNHIAHARAADPGLPAGDAGGRRRGGQCDRGRRRRGGRHVGRLGPGPGGRVRGHHAPHGRRLLAGKRRDSLQGHGAGRRAGRRELRGGEGGARAVLPQVRREVRLGRGRRRERTVRRRGSLHAAAGAAEVHTHD